MSTTASPPDYQPNGNYHQLPANQCSMGSHPTQVASDGQLSLVIDQTDSHPVAHGCISRYPDREYYLRQQAKDAAQQGNYEYGIELLDALIDARPTNATYYNNRGLLHFQAGHFDLAIQDYNFALQLNPKLASAYNNRGNYHATQGHLERAIADYDRAIDLDPGNMRARINQSITFRELGQYEQAIEELDLALQLLQTVYLSSFNANDWIEGHLYRERGRTYHLWGDWNYAIADYQRALALLPKSTSTPDCMSQQIISWLDSLSAS